MKLSIKKQYKNALSKQFKSFTEDKHFRRMVFDNCLKMKAVFEFCYENKLNEISMIESYFLPNAVTPTSQRIIKTEISEDNFYKIAGQCNGDELMVAATLNIEYRKSKWERYANSYSSGAA
jgi:hypothetical protein